MLSFIAIIKVIFIDYWLSKYEKGEGFFLKKNLLH